MIAFGSQSSNKVWSLQLFRTTAHDAREHMRVSRSLTKRHADCSTSCFRNCFPTGRCAVSAPTQLTTMCLSPSASVANWSQELTSVAGCHVHDYAKLRLWYWYYCESIWTGARASVSSLWHKRTIKCDILSIGRTTSRKRFCSSVCEEHVIHHLANKWLFMDMPGLRCPQISKFFRLRKRLMSFRIHPQ